MPPNIACLTSCCTATCEIGSDDFGRSDDTDLGSNWDEIIGDWEIVSNQLWALSDGARAIFQIPDTAGNVPVGVICQINTGDGDKARLLLKYADSTHYYYAEVKVGTGAWIRIYRVDAGPAELLVSKSATIAADTWHEFGFCYGGGKMIARIGDIVAIETITTDIDDQLYAGVEAGLAGFAVFFDDFRYYRATGEDSCPTCAGAEDCTQCATLGQPGFLDVTLASADYSAGCLNGTICGGLNGETYVVPADLFDTGDNKYCEPDDGFPVAGSLSCFYRYEEELGTCTSETADLTIRIRMKTNTDTGRCSIRVNVTLSLQGPAQSVNESATYQLLDFSPFDFNTPFEVPFLSSCLEGTPAWCTFASSGDPITIQAH